MKSKKFISFITAAAMLFSMLPSVVFAADEAQTYTCDFTQLVKNSADTTYGTATDIITLDDYTKAYLTYTGTYVSADGKVYLKSGTVCNGNGKYADGSYIEFTAPSDGTLAVTGADIGWFEGNTYKGYGGSISIDVTANTSYYFGYRKDSTYISSLTFTPSQSSDSTPSPSPDVGTTPDPSGDETAEYASPSTTWDFTAEPPTSGKNKPVISGGAVWADGEVQFPSENTTTGTVTVDMENTIKNNVTIEFDAIDHSKALGQQYFNFTITNSEETIVDFQVHPYSDDYTSVKGLVICGETIADYTAVRTAWGSVGTHHIKIDIDYNALKAEVTVGSTKFTGDIPEGTVSDFKELEISANRSKTAADRYISVDNLKIAEFDSTQMPAVPTVTNGYTEETIAGITCQVKAQDGKPAVIYLASELRMGTDGYSQLYDAKPLFDLLGDSATLIAPQTDGVFTDITMLVSAVKSTYNALSVTVVGQSQNAAAALSSGADKIITIAGKGDTTPTSGKVWAFAGYADEVTPIADVKTMVNRLQTAKIDTRYTEYPHDGHKINDKAASDAAAWILLDASDSKTVDLAIFMGQSNMAGRGDYADAAECAPGHGFEYHSVTEPGVLTTVSEPFGKYENNDVVNDNSGSGDDRRSGDMVSSFMESYYAVSGVPIVGVQCSRGGTESKWWNTDEKMTEAAARYNEAKQYLESCGYTIGKQFMVWCQGESDADSSRSVDTYKSNTKAIFETMKTNTGITDMFMVRIGHCKTSGAAAIDEVKDARYKQINLAQKELADAEDNITAVASFYTDEYAALMRDQYHYHQEAYNSIGAVAGNNTAVTLYENKGTWTNYPEPAADADATPMPVENFEVTSSASLVDVSDLTMYDNALYRVYKSDGSYETVAAQEGKIANASGGEVTIVPEYKFEFTNQASPTDEHINGYVKVGADSYTEEKGYGLVTGGSYSINENGCYIQDYPIRIDLPEGYYDIEIYRKGGARADIYANGVQIINNTTSAGPQNRDTSTALMYAPGIHLTDGSTYFTFGNTSGSNERIASIKITRVPEKYRKPVIWVAGDSESANYFAIDADGDDLDSDKIMFTGFGMQLGKFLSDKYSIANWGQPSATVKTWYDECFESINTLMCEGDTILIDFGINDAISSSNKITVDEMKQCMKEIVTAAKAKGVTPILISPVYNNKYQSKSYFTYSTDTDTNAMYAFAEEIGVECIDLNKWTQLYLNKAAADTNDADWAINNYHIADKLHMTQHGALLAASFIAAGMSEMGYETTDYSYTYKDISSIGEGNVRGTETGTTRVYSVKGAQEFMGIEITETPKPTDTPHSKIIMSYNEESGAVTITSTDSSVTSGTLIKTVYDGGTVKSITSQAVDFNKGAKVTAEKGMVLYLWDSLEGMKPLAEPYRYTGEGTEPTSSPTASPTASPTSSPTTAPTEEPKTMIYSQDFETYSVGDSAWSASAGSQAIREDSANGIGKYLVKISEKNGTCRSAYYELTSAVTENFVFECDYRSTSNANVADLELVEDKNAIYANHGVYSNKNYVFTMARPTGENKYVINNKFDDSGATLASYTDPVFTTTDIENNPWLHVKVTGDMENQAVYVTITSLDGQTEYHHGKYDMNVGRDAKITSWKCIHILGHTSAGDTCIDNIEVYKARQSDLADVYHSVKIKSGSVTFDQYVKDGDSVVNIPDVSVYDENFEGWTVGNDTAKYTSAQLAALPITADCEISANVNANYIEAMASVEFNSFPAGSELVMGEDENNYGSNPISLTITGEQGTSLVTSPDSRVTDYNVEWTFDGFRTLDGAPTGETGNVYCDSYGLLKMTDTAHGTAVDFTLKKTTANYYGRVTAKVTYNGKQLEASAPLVLLADKQKDGAQILPRAGYTSDYNKYDKSLAGYTLESGSDVLFDKWSADGSDGSHYEFGTDSAGNYLRYIRNGTGNSAYGYYGIDDISGETVFEQDVRFSYNGSIQYTGGSATSISSTAFTLAFDGSKLTFNGAQMCAASSNTWYEAVIHADPTSKKATAVIYDMNGAELGKTSAAVDFVNTDYTSGNYYRLNPSKSTNASIDINNVIIREAQINDDSFTVTPASATANIPDSGTATVNITASAKTTDGTDALGKAEWSIDDEFAEGVKIETSGNQSAALTIESTASSGDLPIRCTIGGKSKVVTIKLIGTKDSIAFTSAPTGVQVGTTATYAAVLRDGNGNDKSDAVTYTLYNADNTAAVTPTGVSLNSSTGELTVSDTSAAQIIGVRATSGEISKFIKVNIYNLKFAFAADTVTDGYTPINASTLYSDNRGYGIEGAATANSGTMSSLTFKVKLEKGKVYTVKTKYKGSIVCEKINSSLTGFTRTKSTLDTDEYDVAVFGDDIMDITVGADSEIASVEIAPITKTAAKKPDWWTIGDSTVQQNGSWGYTIASTETTDLSKYPELAEVVNGFHNSGKAGEQHKNFYSNGRLNSILTQMNPGDVVSISGMGTNDSSSSKEQFKEYDRAYADAIIDMGGYVILGSYTPTGSYGATAGKVYDADTMTFKGKRTNAYDLAIRELYEDMGNNLNVLGFVDIGQMADDKMTADVKAAYDAATGDESAKRAAANAKAEEMMAWWKDYNHYYTTFSDYILPDITKSVAELIGTINR